MPTGLSKPTRTVVPFSAVCLVTLRLAVGVGASPGKAPRRCTRCHGEGSERKSALVVSPSSLGVHRRIACGECHPEATTVPHASGPAPQRWANRCGRCHRQAFREFSEDVHGKRLAAGSADAPTCTSCHGTHTIYPASSSRSRVSRQHVVATCARCHDDPVVIGRSKLSGNVVDSYLQSYHGLAQEYGSLEAANCYSCHGGHGVFPSADPRSSVHPANLKKTCGGCHAEPEEFAGKKVHTRRTPGKKAGWWTGLRVFCPIANRSLNPLTIAGLGALVGVLSGIFGVGGGFLLTPLLILFGIPPAVAAATDSAQITAGASSGAIAHYRHGNVDVKLGLIILAGGIAGGSVGVQVVRLLREMGNFDFALKIVYVIVLGGLGLLMLVEGVTALRKGARGAEGEDQTPGERKPSRLHAFFRRAPLQMRFPRAGVETSALLPFGAGFAVGGLAAFLGVGGGFIMIPAMIYLIGMPTHVAIGTDLFQITLVCANVTIQQAVANQTVDLLLAVTLFAGSVLGAQVGARIGQRLPGEQIRVFLAIIVLVVMVMLARDLVTRPENLVSLAQQAGGGH